MNRSIIAAAFSLCGACLAALCCGFAVATFAPGAVAAQASSHPARADDVFACKDDKGNAASIIVSYAQKKVTQTSGEKGGGQCVLTFTNGAYGNLISSPPGDMCLILVLSGVQQKPARQVVTFSGHTIAFGVPGHTQTLDTETGVNAFEGKKVQECHRSRA